MSKVLSLIAIAFLWSTMASSQSLNIFTDKGLFYHLPLSSDSIRYDGKKLSFPRHNEQPVQLKTSDIDSITIGDVVFRNAVLYITTENGQEITSRTEWLNCHFNMDGGTLFDSFEADGRIRGRGNSTWSWYEYGGDPLIYGRRPYKIKFNQKQRVMDMNADKTWVLLANWRDGSFMMNAFANEVGRYLDFAFTPHNRFCEVYINGEYAGLYQLCEQIQQGGHRVNCGENGILLAFDADDGPALSPNATDNFWSNSFRLPVSIKYPKDEALTDSAKTAVITEFNRLEALIKRHNYNEVAAVLDIRSLIDFLIVQELTCNVELDAPRSMYIYQTDSDHVWHFGPLWDFDAGFDFSWADMCTGHTYFSSQKLLYDTDPANHPNYSSGTRFFLQMFADPQFTAEYKARWAEIKDGLLSYVFDRLDNYRYQLTEAQARNDKRWPIYFSTATFERVDYNMEYAKLRNWVRQRIRTMNTAIQKYPAN
ncbi:MAG: CotH kinase family protein [Bacteroidaceae bacterium]|nr:CotH kinase family protein [Bacteroidaceae bacterium]